MESSRVLLLAQSRDPPLLTIKNFDGLQKRFNECLEGKTITSWCYLSGTILDSDSIWRLGPRSSQRFMKLVTSEDTDAHSMGIVTSVSGSFPFASTKWLESSLSLGQPGRNGETQRRQGTWSEKDRNQQVKG